jgi:hypothetical protein
VNAASAQNTQDLLADIFGSGAGPASTANAASAPAARSNVDDIMSLFGGSSASPVAQAANSSPSSPLDVLSQMSSSPVPAAAPKPPVAAAPPVVRPQLQSYTAYEKHGLKITLTPKISPAQPGMVQILAKFQVMDGVAVHGVNFQAAVPKVSQSRIARAFICIDLTFATLFSDSTTANACHVQRRRATRSDRDPANAYHRSTWSPGPLASPDILHQGRRSGCHGYARLFRVPAGSDWRCTLDGTC